MNGKLASAVRRSSFLPSFSSFHAGMHFLGGPHFSLSSSSLSLEEESEGGKGHNSSHCIMQPSPHGCCQKKKEELKEDERRNKSRREKEKKKLFCQRPAAVLLLFFLPDLEWGEGTGKEKKFAPRLVPFFFLSFFPFLSFQICDAGSKRSHHQIPLQVGGDTFFSKREEKVFWDGRMKGREGLSAVNYDLQKSFLFPPFPLPVGVRTINFIRHFPRKRERRVPSSPASSSRKPFSSPIHNR